MIVKADGSFAALFLCEWHNGYGSKEGSCIAKPSLENVLSQAIQSLQHLLGVLPLLLLMPSQYFVKCIH